MAKNGTPRLTYNDLLIMAGIEPTTGLPSRFKLKGGDNQKIDLKANLKAQIRIIDEQNAVNKGTWYNLPCDLTSQELERLLYYKGQLAFFYVEELDKFYFMPYALDGTIDFYGRYNSIHPVPMTSGTEQETNTTQAEILSQMKLNCIYGVVLPEEVTPDMLTKSCVLLHDYTKQLSQNIIPRFQLQDAVIDVEAEMIPLMRTNLLSNCGVEGMRVQDADQQDNVADANKTTYQCAMEGDIYNPIVGTIDFQELTGKSGGSKAEEFMMAMQSLDNFRLSAYGLDNGGLFEKKAHVLNAEEEVNQSNVSLVAQDYVSVRQNFCNICNSIWGTTMWYEPSQNETGADTDGDGLLYDRSQNNQNGGIENANDTNV